ncbi:MAG: hypothetical protein RIN55_05580 [Tissierellaceae bacterium]|nr:hypothetical protein [Tissierellaceae bacterium]
MIKLRIELNKILKSIHPNIIIEGKSISRVHFQKATDTTPYPYIVYDFPQGYDNEGQEIFNLDIDIWDNNIDTTELETLAGAIWKKLNKYYFIDDDMQFSIHRVSRFTVDEDDDIKRRTLMFNIRYYDRRVNE